VRQGAVLGVGEGAEHVAFGVGGRVEQAQRLVRVGGDDHGVEPVRLAVRVAHLGVVRVAAHRADGRGQPDLVQPLGGPLDVAAGSAGDGPPRRRPGHRQHPVIGQEREQVPGRIA
jgi:hypothetical protein